MNHVFTSPAKFYKSNSKEEEEKKIPDNLWGRRSLVLSLKSHNCNFYDYTYQLRHNIEWNILITFIY